MSGRKTKGRKKSAAQENRERILEALKDVYEQLTARRAVLQEAEDSLDALSSVVDGLYIEVDKLSKKAPVDRASELMVTHVNEAVKEIRRLAADDPHVLRLNEFVPAGDNPEHRDVVLVVGQIAKAIERCLARVEQKVEAANGECKLGAGLVAAMEIFLADGVAATSNDLKHNGVSLPNDWFIGSEYSDEGRLVNMHRIEELDGLDFFDLKESV